MVSSLSLLLCSPVVQPVSEESDSAVIIPQMRREMRMKERGRQVLVGKGLCRFLSV